MSKISDPGFVHSGVTGLNAAQYIPCSTQTVTTKAPASTCCTLCGFTGSPKEYADHNCFANRDDPPEPNRFDPFEALDELLELSPLAGVRRNVECLRAYITGIEQ